MCVPKSSVSWLEVLNGYQSAQEMRNSLLDAHPYLKKGHLSRLAIMGAGPEGRRLADICAKNNIDVVAVFDGNASKRGIELGPCRVAPSDAIGSLDREIPVIVASHRVLGAIDSLRAMGFRAVPFGLLQTVMPDVFSPHMFYEGLLEDLYDNRRKYHELAAILADDESRKVLDRLLGFRMTMDPTYLRDIVDWDLYGPSGILKFGDDEVYVDGGSYDGDSIRMFIAHAHGKFDRILGFEPDPATFKRLSENFRDEPRVDAINKGLHLKTAELRFENDGSRGAIFTESGGACIPVIGLDEVLKGDRVSFIKMNIEGAEIDALNGAAQSIKKWSPKLAISAYHRPSDLWRIPALIGALNDGYNLYLRQHDGGIIETVLYAC